MPRLVLISVSRGNRWEFTRAWDGTALTVYRDILLQLQYIYLWPYVFRLRAALQQSETITVKETLCSCSCHHRCSRFAVLNWGFRLDIWCLRQKASREICSLASKTCSDPAYSRRQHGTEGDFSKRGNEQRLSFSDRNVLLMVKWHCLTSLPQTAPSLSSGCSACSLPISRKPSDIHVCC